MIFDREDLEILRRVMVRKGIESAAVPYNPHLTEVQRLLVAQELVRDISRCQLMICVAEDELSDIASGLDGFTDELSSLPPTIYSAYMESMNQADRDDEGQYLWMLSAMVAHLDMFRSALDSVDMLSRAEPVLTHREIRDIKGLRDTLPDICRRSEALDGDGFEPGMLAEALSDECSLLLRIISGKDATSREISDVLDRLSKLDTEEFLRIFGPDLGADLSELVLELTETDGRYIPLLCARCILNSSMA